MVFFKVLLVLHVYFEFFNDFCRQVFLSFEFVCIDTLNFVKNVNYQNRIIVYTLKYIHATTPSILNLKIFLKSADT